ncbi:MULTISPECIES: hypothetical protein [Paenibacillus]|jgi:hypothetical protein|uniref:DUF2922 domain-containing protein n=1 Tax=Paenibacillus baimaensis TaxID=2982185 RepID=A0ABT2UKP5_9BACL|nr:MULTISPECIES: hypothetical protein [unclassified Paenibacillus]MCU6795172.1 hypothetical protein [Paenibacillus sp. WQ 127069]OMF06814.1 hypothetical protein BK127_30930 [Paenibacillus sp. FSL H7-0331]
MKTEILFHDHKIPVRFISSDQKAIPSLIQALEHRCTQPEEPSLALLNRIDLIEVVGNNAILYTSIEEESILLPLS